MARRGFLRRSLLAGAGGAVGCGGWELDPLPTEPDPPGGECEDPFAGGEPLGTVPFEDGGVPFREKVGVGWDARIFFDLALLEPDRLVVDNDQFYVRTELPDELDTSVPWTIRVHGLIDEEVTLSIEDIEAAGRDQGVHLLECSGNADGGSFGLMSAAAWAGAPLVALLSRLPLAQQASRVLVSGFDGHSVPSENGHSTPGASWIFTLEELADAGAFLATEMNGVPLPPDHGAPVRLLVPGWYGCTCIKWVDTIELVDEDAPATSQMREFASRTHQLGTPNLARDYLPATIDQAAMPIRIEKWRLGDGAVAYRIVGILWGGYEVTNALTISVGGQQQTVLVCPAATTNQTWTLWEHLWRPAAPGVYSMRMAIADPSIPTRRLDAGWYERSARIDDV